MSVIKAIWGPASLVGWKKDAFITHDINAGDRALAWCFNAPKGGVINAVGIYIDAITGNPPAYDVGVYDQAAGGEPDTASPAGGSATQSYDFTVTGWHWITLGTPATVNVGDWLAAAVKGNVGTPPDGGNFVKVRKRGFGNVTSPRLMYQQSGYWYKERSYGNIAVRYNDGQVHGVACVNLFATAFDQADTPDELGCKFTLPFDCKCFGASVGFHYEYDGSFEVRLYDAADNVLATTVVSDPDYVRGPGSDGFHGQFFFDSVDLTAGLTYRLTVRSTHATGTIGIAEITFDAEASRDFMPEGARWEHTDRTDLGAWTDDHDKLPYMALWLEDMTIPGGNGNGVVAVVHASVPPGIPVVG